VTRVAFSLAGTGSSSSDDSPRHGEFRDAELLVAESRPRIERAFFLRSDAGLG
jgi:hypothetical protein